MDNSSLSLIDNGVLTNRWFQQQNPGRHLGDTGNDILQVNDTLDSHKRQLVEHRAIHPP